MIKPGQTYHCTIPEQQNNSYYGAPWKHCRLVHVQPAEGSEAKPTQRSVTKKDLLNLIERAYERGANDEAKGSSTILENIYDKWKQQLQSQEKA